MSLYVLAARGKESVIYGEIVFSSSLCVTLVQSQDQNSLSLCIFHTASYSDLGDSCRI